MFIHLSRWNLFATMITTVLGAVLVSRSNSSLISDRVLKLYWFLCNNSLCFACCISCIYWTMLDDGRDMSLNNFLVHATNSLVLIVDLFIVSHPHRMSHCIYVMTCGAVYMLFTIVFTFLGGRDNNGGNYAYPILDWKHQSQKATIVGVGATVALGIAHVIVGGLHCIRNQIHRCLKGEKTQKHDQTLPFVSKNLK